MFNTDVKTVGDEVTIKINLKQQGRASASGKSLVIASTEGNQSIATVNGKAVYLGLNCYTK